MDPRTAPLAEECKRQEESCLYTSTSLYIWLRQTRNMKRIFVIAPILIGAVATLPDLNDDPGWRALFVMSASLFPAVFEALKLDVHLDTIAHHAGLFKSLQDRFRQARLVTALGAYEDFRAEFDGLMLKMDRARESSLTPPERCFRKAQEKIDSGDYDFTVDSPRKPGA